MRAGEWTRSESVWEDQPWSASGWATIPSGGRLTVTRTPSHWSNALPVVRCGGAPIDGSTLEAFRNIAFALLGLLVLLALAGASYQTVATSVDAHRVPEPGRLVDMGGFRR